MNSHPEPQELSDEEIQELEQFIDDNPNVFIDDPLVPTPEATTLESEPSFAEKRDALNKYFKSAVDNKKWLITKPMPRAKKDAEFDKLLKDLGLSSKRSYASSIWRSFKRKKGVLAAIKILKSFDELFETYQRRTTEYGTDRIVNSAIKSTLQHPFPFVESDMEIVHLVLECDSTKESVSSLLRKLDSLLAKVVTGLSESNLGPKMTEFENGRQRLQREFSIERSCHFSSVAAKAKKKSLLRTVFCRLERETVDSWKKSMNTSTTGIDDDGLVDVVAEGDVDGIVQGSKPTVYYIAGYLLFSCSKMTNGQSGSAIEQFIKHNTISQQDLAKSRQVKSTDSTDNNDATETTKVRSLPDSVLSVRERHQGKLKRASPLFFGFVLMMEALYILNLTPANALRFKGDLFVEIDGVVSASNELRQQFIDCLPPTFNTSETKELLDVYNKLLAKYGRLRARDLLRKLKRAKRRTALAKKAKAPTDDISTRTYVKTKGASTEQKPSS